jgi:uncharacterized membrane protein YqhA
VLVNNIIIGITNINVFEFIININNTRKKQAIDLIVTLITYLTCFYLKKLRRNRSIDNELKSKNSKLLDNLF